MAQIPRPFQLALVAVVLLAGVWLFALQGHSSNPTAASSTAAPEVTSTVSSAPSPARTRTHHSTPSIHSAAGKTNVAAKHAGRSGQVSHAGTPASTGSSHTAASARTSAASKPQGHTRQAPSAAPAHRPSSATSSSASSTSRSSATGAPSASSPSEDHGSASKTSSASGAVTRAAAPVTRHGASATKNASVLATPAGQREVEGELKQGKIVVLLFWNPAGSDDQAVHDELQLVIALHHLATKANAKAVQHVDKVFGWELNRQIAVHEAQASQVTQYGSITRSVQIYGTPTLLVINPKGQAIIRTGLIDAYAIEQAIEEARSA